MTKIEFMQRLERALSPLRKEERQDILADFEEHFQNGLASGKSEAEVAEELGDPVVLAAQYTEGLPPVQEPIRPAGVARAILATLGLLLFDAMIALPVVMTLLGLWLGLWGGVAGLLAGSLACLIAPFFGWLATGSFLTALGIFILGIALLALTILAGIGMVYVTRGFYRGLAGYVRMHIRIIGGSTK